MRSKDSLRLLVVTESISGSSHCSTSDWRFLLSGARVFENYVECSRLAGGQAGILADCLVAQYGDSASSISSGCSNCISGVPALSQNTQLISYCSQAPTPVDCGSLLAKADLHFKIYCEPLLRTPVPPTTTTEPNGIQPTSLLVILTMLVLI